MKMGRFFVLVFFLLSLAACSSNTPGGKKLYDNSEPPKLLDAEIRMETQRRLKGDKHPDVRIIRVKDGVLSCSLESPARKLKGTGPYQIKDYANIWRHLDELGGFDQESEAPDHKGGYYHAITFRLGHRMGETSAQNRSNFLGLGTTDIQARLSLANAITRTIEEQVNLLPWPTEETESKSP